MKLIRAVAAFALGTLVVSGTEVQAQDKIYGCYVKNTGTVYRIKVAGTPSECSNNHSEFAWNVQGAPGPQGPSGIHGITTRTRLGTLPNMGSTDIPVECEPGEYAIGGGFTSVQTPYAYLVRRNAPLVDPTTGRHYWRVSLQSTGGPIGGGGAVVGYAICVATSNP